MGNGNASPWHQSCALLFLPNCKRLIIRNGHTYTNPIHPVPRPALILFAKMITARSNLHMFEIKEEHRTLANSLGEDVKEEP